MPRRTSLSLANQRLKRAGYQSRITRLVSNKKRRLAPPRRRAFSLNVHHFSRYTAATTLEVNGTTAAGAFEYKFDDILNSSEFTSLFDQYKLTKCILKLQLITNPDSANPTNIAAGGISTYYNNPTNWYPKFWYIRDYDGGGSDSLAQIKERQGVKFFVMRPNKTYNISVSPSVSVQTYRTATTTGYGPRKMFLDMGAGTDVPHYGLHYVVDTLGLDPDNAYPFKIRYEFQYFFTCKDVR